MAEKIEVSKIVVKMGKKEVELSLAEALELKELLNETFGKKETVFIPSSPTVIPYPYPVRPWPYRYWEVTCGRYSTGDTSGVITYSLSSGLAG